jgi:hypothetical protein
VGDNPKVPKAQIRLIWLILPILACFPVLLNHARSDGLLRDTDTKVLLATIRETANPLAWFVGDWPLKNHFYRPISTLVFEADNALYGGNAQGYGFTNALIACACILLVFWLVRELIDDWPMAGLASLVFGLWHWRSSPDPILLAWVMPLMALAALFGLRHGRARAAASALVALACLGALEAYGPIYSVPGRIIDWIPGRTASVMTAFCLLSAAAYVRWERLSAQRRTPTPPTATDRPLRADGPAVSQFGGKLCWGWLVLAFVSLALALGSYEQAIMLPAVLLGSAILMAIRGLRPRWGVHAGFWALMGGYLILRGQLVSSSVSQYQGQQYRDGPGVLLDIFNYTLPPINQAQTMTILPADPFVLLTSSFWNPIIAILGFGALAWLAAKDEERWSILAVYLMAAVAFLPMAWFKLFEHYHYWSSAYRAIFSVLTIGTALKGVIAAVSPQALQAPPRLDPAPGSLPLPGSSPPAS